MSFLLRHICPPTLGGIHDFVERLSHEIESSTTISNSTTDMDSADSKSCVLLHYSGYGFSKRGAPLRLLQDLKSRSTNGFLGIFFHELYAFGPPWRSSFWLSPVQRYIACRLAQLSDFWITNREESAQWLRRVAGDKPHSTLPVFSTMGEAPEYIARRQPKIVIFGSRGLRLATYRSAGNSLFNWARKQGLEVHDIGPTIEDAGIVTELRRAGVILHGRLAAEEVSTHLSDAMFGVVAYPVGYVAKSTVFAAFCAHGGCPVLISKHYLPADGLVAGVHYLAGIPNGVLQQSHIGSVAAAAWAWYQPHRVTAHVDAIHHLTSRIAATVHAR